MTDATINSQERLVDENTAVQGMSGEDSVPREASVVGNAEDIVPSRTVEDETQFSTQNAQQNTVVIESVFAGP